MRVTIIFLLAVVSVIPSIAQSSSEKVSLDIGSVTVSLGMSRQEVINKCAAAGYKQVLSDKDSIMFQSGDNFYSTLYRDGHLVFADRSWYLGSKGDVDAFQSTLAALESFVDRRSNSLPSCTIIHDHITEPDESLNRIFIYCGKRSFLLTDGKMGGKHVNDVRERIGEIPADKH